MSSEPAAFDWQSLREELRTLAMRGPSPGSHVAWSRLLATAEAGEAAGDPEAPDHLAEVLFIGGYLATLSNRDPEAESLYARAVPLARAALDVRPDEVARRDRLGSLHYNLGNIYSGTGRLDEAEAAYRAALPLQEANTRDHPSDPWLRNHLAQTMFNLGNVFLSRNRHSDAAEWFRSARDQWIQLKEAEPEELGHAHNLGRSYFNLAYVVGHTGPSPEAFAAFHRAEEVWEQLLAVDPGAIEPRFDVARCYFNHSGSLLQAGEHEAAREAVEASLVHFDRLLAAVPGDETFEQLREQARGHRAWLIANAPDKLAARTIAEADRNAATARDAGDWRRLSEIGSALYQKAETFSRSNRPVEMERIYREAIALIAEAARLDPSPNTAHFEAAVWFDLNLDLRALGLYDGSEEAVRTALRRWERLHNRYPEDPRFGHWLAGAHNNLGIICADTGRSATAEAAYRQALALREQMARANPQDANNQLYVGGSYCNLGNLYLDRGEIDTAQSYYRQAIQTIEPVAGALANVPQVAEFLKNARNGLAACEQASSVPANRNVITQSVAWAIPDAEVSIPADLARLAPDVAEAFARADALRLAGDPAADGASAELLNRAPECPEVWLLRGLVLGYFRSDDKPFARDKERCEEACTAFYEALVLRPDYYEAKLYKGWLLRTEAHVAQARFRAMHDLAEQLPEAQREKLLSPVRRRFRYSLSRSRESLEAAARLRPEEPRPLADLAELYIGLGYADEGKPFLERLRKIDSEWARELERSRDE